MGFKSCGVVAMLAVLGGCRVNGSPTLYRVGADDNLLHGAWYDENPEATEGWVRWTPQDQPSPDHDDCFSIVLDRAFFKYLPDAMGVNEALIVLTFQEGGGDENRLVKILGPNDYLPDQTPFNEQGRVVYGPKRVESNVLSIQMQVVEFDAGENQEHAALLDFIGGAAEKLAIADPVTAGEIKLAKELGKTIIELNKDDIVLDVKFDLVPYDPTLKPAASPDSRGILPLKSGRFAIIKPEKQTPIFEPFSATKTCWRSGGWFSKTLGLVGAVPFDIVKLPVAIVAPVLSDRPDRASLSELDLDDTSGAIYDGDASTLGLQPQPRFIKQDPRDRGLYLDNGSTFYDRKTWLTFSVVAGGDPSTWERRKVSSAGEAHIQDLMREGTLAKALGRSKVIEGIETVVEALKKQEEVEKSKPAGGGQIRLRDPDSGYLYTPVNADAKLEIERPASLKDKFSSALWGKKGEKPEAVERSHDGKDRDEFTVKVPSSGVYQLTPTYAAKSGLKNPVLDVHFVPKPVLSTLAADWKTPWSVDAERVIETATEGGFDEVKSVVVTGMIGDAEKKVTFPRDKGFTPKRITLKYTGSAALDTITSVKVAMRHGLEDQTASP